MKLKPEEASERIIQLVMELTPNLSENLNENQLTFYVDKFIADCLAYCHIRFFPSPLIYSAVDLIKKRLVDEMASSTSSETSIANLPLKKITQGDTSFEFAINNIDLAGCLSDLDFESLKPKLNLYRRVISW